ncbi:hypothetical protein ACWF82_16305 [Nocardia sp. NPDC055053]
MGELFMFRGAEQIAGTSTPARDFTGGDVGWSVLMLITYGPVCFDDGGWITALRSIMLRDTMIDTYIGRV